MISINRVTLLGNLGKDPEIKNSGVSVATFSIATTDHYKGKTGHSVDKTTWHNIVAFGYLAEKAMLLKKGDVVFIDGKINVDDYTDKSGNKKYFTKIVANILEKYERLPVKRSDEFSKQDAEPTQDNIPF